MARDVEFNVTANDKTGSALASAEAKFKASQKRIEDTQKASLGRGAKGLVDLVEGVSPKLTSTLTKAFAGAGDAVAPALISGAAVAAPIIGATINAAVAAGVAVGVTGIGVALVSQDAKVKAAGSQLGKSLFSSLQQDASPFIGPVLDAIDTIDARFNALRPTIQRVFTNASKFVAPLTGGVLKAVESVIGGVDRLVAKSAGVVDETAKSIEDIGDSVGNFLGNINTADAQGAITGLTGTIVGLIDILGPLLNGLTKVYSVANKLGLTGLGSLNSNLGQTGTLTGRVAGQTDVLAGSFQKVSEDTYDYEGGLRAAEAAVQGLYSANRDLYGSTTDVGKAFATANEAAKENGRTLDANKPKGQANRDALLGVATALQRNYEGYVKVNGEGAGAAALAGRLRDRFVALAGKMGASSGEAKRLADRLLGIPNVRRTVSVETGQANAAAAALKARLAAIKDRSVYVNVAFNQGRINKVQAQLDRIGNSTFDANQSFTQPAGADGGGLSRTGGATPVSVNSRVSVALDGQPFYDFTARSIQASNDRNAWRARVGAR